MPILTSIAIAKTFRIKPGGSVMVRKALLVAALAIVAGLASSNETQAQQPQAYGQAWGGAASNRDYQRFNHYPYVYYPQNFYGNEYFKSSDSLYYPTNQRYHWGHQFLTDVF